MKKERFKLTERVAVRMTPLERKMLKSIAEGVGLSESVCVRSLIRRYYSGNKVGILWK